MKRYLGYILPVLYFLASISTAHAEVHRVSIIDHAFVPKDLVINEGDSVEFRWKADNHNVVSGIPFDETGAFTSALEDTGYIWTVVFNRNLLNQYPEAGNRYDYYCEPHAAMGMVGSITVLRQETFFKANLDPWQVVPENQTNSKGECQAELNDSQTELSLSCNHNMSGISSADMLSASLGTNGQSICSLSTSETSASGLCLLNTADVEKLFQNGLYLELISATAKIRGQLVGTGGDQTVSGQVTYPDGQAFPGVTVTDGLQTAVSDADGMFLLSSVLNGVYQLTAFANGYEFVAGPGTNPYLVDSSNVTNRSLIGLAPGFPSDPNCLVDTDGDGICDSREISDSSNPQDAGSYKTRLESPVDSIWNGFLSMTNILELVNRSVSTIPLTVKLYSIEGELVSEQSFILEANGHVDVIVNDLPGFTADSFGIVRLEFDKVFNGFIDGGMSFYRANLLGGFEFAFHVPFEKPVFGKTAVSFNTFQPSFNASELSNQVAQWLTIVNLHETKEKSFSLKRFDQLGNLLGEESFSIPAFGRRDLEAGHVLPGASQVGMHIIEPLDKTSPYLAQLLRYGSNAPAGFVPLDYSFAFPLSARSGNGQTQVVPVSSQREATNWLELVNVLDEEVQLELKIYDSSSQVKSSQLLLIPAYSQIHLEISSLLGPDNFGRAEIKPNLPQSIIGQSMFYFRDPLTGSISAMYGSSLKESYGLNTYGSYNLFLGMESNLKVFNTLAENQNITLKVISSAGELHKEIFNLEANSGMELELQQTEIFSTSLDTYGVVELEAENDKAIFSELTRFKPDPISGLDFAMPTPFR